MTMRPRAVASRFVSSFADIHHLRASGGIDV
jgi:hypothetical protein